jgi:formate hydrogenlyase subunit 3/multisubunit Na+/H+ antiporter MnhD subunit
MVSKDQSIGGAIFLICLIIAIFYVITLFYPDWIVNLGWAAKGEDVQFWLIAIPVFIAFIAVMGIGAWIGWTMATTPPPKPIEEITSEIEEEEKKEEKEAEIAKESKEEATETEEKGKGKTKK